MVRNGTTHVAPRFATEDGLSFQVEALYPVNEASYMVLGGQTYDVDPATWMLYFGVTTDLGGILGKLTPQ